MVYCQGRHMAPVLYLSRCSTHTIEQISALLDHNVAPSARQLAALCLQLRSTCQLCFQPAWFGWPLMPGEPITVQLQHCQTRAPVSSQTTGIAWVPAVNLGPFVVEDTPVRR
jgi:hypothetical protein